ncbi:hypothetical protein K4L44_02450 [Halosquirtibacter laminarini]|uniref:Uncharacterized protein n=1 Tax=Halosquirtibacter laminarini TaxID=3374600 RepID=A0AC61NGH3_9BACT|nr:hypothetical protein K4L44_02450 [Prolixibacteraceae bacterium]
MTEKESRLLHDFENKVLRLTSMYSTLQEKYGELERSNQMLRDQINDLQGQNLSLSDDLQNALMADALIGADQGSKMTKKKINQLIKEIDQCIAMLSK